MKTKTQTLVTALAIMITLAIVPTLTFGQNKVDKQIFDSPQNEQDNALVGVWEKRGPTTTNCQTGLPDTNSPTISELYTFNQGGTMSEDNTDPIDGPYRTTAHGIWKRTWGRNYTAVYTHYSFDPDRTHVATVKIKTNIRLSRDLNSFTENGTFEVFDPNGNPLLDPDGNPIRGCFSDTSIRLRF